MLVSNFSTNMMYFSTLLIHYEFVHFELTEHTAEILRKTSVRAEGSELIVIIIYFMKDLIDFDSSF